MEMSEQPAAAADGGGADKLRLKVASGNAAGTVIEVEDELVIGRQAAGAGTLANDIEISRQHARIASDPDGRYLIEDLGSTNGTYVNGRAVDSPVTLEPGDRIEVGSSALIVQVSAVPHTPRSTPVTTTSAVEGLDQAGVEEPPSAGPPLIPEPPLSPEPPSPAPAAAETEIEDAGVEVEAPLPGLEAPLPGLPPLGLRIEFDVVAHEVTIQLDEGGGEVKLVYEDGRWRLE